MLSTMQDVDLSIGTLLRHGSTIHGSAEVVTMTDRGTRRRSYADVGRRCAALAHALRGLGIDADQRVATFMWNNAEHLEAYLAVPSMGAVLHTLNIRLFPEQLIHVVNHAEDRVIIVDPSLIDLLEPHMPQMPTVEHIVVTGDGTATITAGDKVQVHAYEDLLARESDSFDWPDINERSAAAMCYTSGTTGIRKASPTRIAPSTSTRWRPACPSRSTSPRVTGCSRWSRSSTRWPGGCPTRPSWSVHR